MGKAKPRRLDLPFSSPPARSALARMPVRYSWKKLGLACLILMGGWGIWWYGVRPYQFIQQGKELLARDPREAALLLEEAVTTSPGSDRDAAVLWVRALLRSGRWEEALGCFSQIQHPELADDGGLLELADDASVAGVTLLAVMSLEAITSTDARWGDAMERRIAIKQQGGDELAVLKLATEFAGAQPDNPHPWLVMARTHEQRMSLTEAAMDYRKYLAREHNPGRRTEGVRAFVRILIHLGLREEARTWQNELSSTPTALTLTDRHHEAQLKRLEGNLSGAWSEIEAVLQADTNRIDALELRGTLAIDRGDYRQAETDLLRVLARQPWSRQAHYKLFQALIKQGQADAAAEHLQESRRLLALSNRILQLRSQRELTPVELGELEQALDQTGLKASAELLRQRASE